MARSGAAPLTLYASFGRTSREPARNDLFDGADDLNSSNAASILPLTQVKPETVDDYEARRHVGAGGFFVQREPLRDGVPKRDRGDRRS